MWHITKIIVQAILKALLHTAKVLSNTAAVIYSTFFIARVGNLIQKYILF